MPLIKSASKKAFRENVRREIEAGRPVNQAVAIAYRVQREAMKRGRRKGRSLKMHLHKDADDFSRIKRDAADIARTVKALRRRDREVKS